MEGSCGLEKCKIPDLEHIEKNSFELDFGLRYTNFDFLGRDGSYEEMDLRLSFMSKQEWMVNVKVPFIHFTFADKQTSGFANPVISFEKWFARDGFSPSFGLQLELPLGEDKKGVAPDHFELLPYVGIGYSVGAYSLRLITGYRFSIDDSKHSDATVVSEKKLHVDHVDPNAPITLASVGPQVVNFHAKEEIQVFVFGGRYFIKNKLLVGLQSSARQSTAGGENLLLIYGGPSMGIKTKFVYIRTEFSAPFSSDKKMNWSAGLNVTCVF